MTGEKKYLDEAKFFLDMRGKTDRKDQYSQADKPVVEQTEAWGHAVRAGYMYAGMADVAALTGDESYIHAIDAIWDNIVSKKLYVTGGVGSTNNGEAFEGDYILPNMSAYCETCAAIANVYVNYRLFLLHGESKYYDVLERSLYNAVISGISLDGGGFFYPNPLESMGQHQRQSWFGCACCPSNACRFIPSLPGYMYAVKDDNVYVNLFNTSTVALKVGGKDVELEQETNYPWDGTITLRVKKNKAGTFNLKVRYPGWAHNEVVPSNLYSYTAAIDKKNYIIDTAGEHSGITSDGYITISGNWKKGETVTIKFPMNAKAIIANEHVEADRDKVAIQRGPLVYCAEWPDNDFNVLSTVISPDARRKAEESTITIKTTPANQGDEVKEQTYPFVRLSMDAEALSYDDNMNVTRRKVSLNLIPYYAWAHRGRGNMEVWLATQDDAAKPTWPDTYASTSKVTGSHRANYSAINDHLLPKDSNDHSIPYFHWWPKEGTTEWICYEFPKAGKVSESTIWWFDDGPWGGCRVPKSWKLYYEDANGNFQPVQAKSAYGTKKDVANRVTFTPVTTKKLKLEVQLPERHAAGLFEWEVK